ncbi:MAG TPA: hypothetical protein VGC14_07730 [Rhizobium sp.]
MIKFNRCESIAKAALDAVQTGEPFSLIRIGDGENSVIQYPDYCCEPRIQYVFRRALEDRIYTKDEILSVKAAVITSMDNADVVGMHDTTHSDVLCRL